MNPQDALPLRDFQLPDVVSWWPPALGWWMVLIASVLIIVLSYWLIKKIRQPVLRKGVVVEKDRVIADYLKHQDKNRLLKELSMVLRRIGMSYQPRNVVAGMLGHHWFQQLNQLVDRNTLSDEVMILLSTAPYQKDPLLSDEQVQTVIEQVNLWVSVLPKNSVSGGHHVTT